MTFKHFSTIVFVALSPAAAIAQESSSCDRAHANCKEGTIYDEKTQACVVVSS